MKKSRIFLIGFAFLSACNSFSDDVDTCTALLSQGVGIAKVSNFPHFSTQLIRQLEDQCVEKVGDLKLDKLEKQMSEVQGYMLVGGYMASGPDGNRQTGNCDPEHKRVIVSCYSFMYGDPESRKLLGMHEGLCAAGYNDEDFQLSTSLWLLAKQKATAGSTGAAGGAQDLPFFKDIPKLNRTPTYPILINGKPGGSTGVGGGGDQRIVSMKTDVLSKAMQKFGQLSHENQAIFEKIINSKIEFSTLENGFHAQVRNGPMKNGRMSFVIDWNHNLSDEDRDRIADKILDLLSKN